ncbi:GDSL-type esterase/lipase family protein [Sutcliffiella deserti]|uniref:GDSL-type esterase/lipase family protein n=1 Tax=Sutcliffiella deserti TaxID=2875501 RepID=UPI001CBAF372|nr:GDSL-type esterase/lipase family protein [Sutcliffiella deserti]
MQKMIRIAVLVLFVSLISYPPVTAESPKHITYIALGDSLTAGLGSSEENYLRLHGFVPQFTKYLRLTSTVKVENYGIPGLTSTGLFALLQADEALRNRLKTANIISVSIGGNDFLQTIRANSTVEEEELNLSMRILKNTIGELYDTLRHLNPEAKIFLIGLYNPYPSGHELHQHGSEYAPKYNEILEELASSSTLVVSPYEAFIGKEDKLTHILEEDIHPNDLGYTEIVTLMKDAYE